MANFWKKLNKPILALAPMAGITDSAYREICRKHGADVVYSEMASVSALFYKPQKTLELLKFNNKERPYVVQLFGKSPEHFAKAARIISEIIKPDGIDINFGCPAKKVFGHGSGCAIMAQKVLARKIIQAVLENTDLPVSLKIRAGVKNISALKFIENIKDLDFQAVMIHCRTYEQGFSGTPDYSISEKIKRLIPDKIVLINGGINATENGAEIIRNYPSLDGLGIARGVLGSPWIFKEIKAFIKNVGVQFIEPENNGKPNEKFDKSNPYNNKYNFNQIKKVAIEHAKLLYKNKGERGLFEIRKHLIWYFKGFPGASELRKKLVQVKSIKEIEKNLKSIR